MIGAVVPVYNRRDNLELLLTSLERQSYTGFHVVVADDGSTNSTRELVEERAGSTTWGGRLRLGCGPNQGVRTGRARNIGAANLKPGSRWQGSPPRTPATLMRCCWASWSGYRPWAATPYSPP